MNLDQILNEEPLWYFDDEVPQNCKVRFTPRKTNEQSRKLVQWAESLGCQAGPFQINIGRRMIQDPMGEIVAPILPQYIGMEEAALIKELMAQIGG